MRSWRILQNQGFRYIEALVITIIALIGGCFVAELIFANPDLGGILGGFIPQVEVILSV